VASVGVQPQPVQTQTSFFQRDSRLRFAVLSLLLAVATIAVYAPVHDHPFASIDDGKYVTQNPHIQDGPTPGLIFWAFTHGYAGNYHPVTWVSHAIDVRLFGLDPTGHHDENVLLHAINAILLFWVLKRATGYTWRSLMVAALFALHPLNVESVAWIAERKTMLSTLFCLLALGAYRWYAAKPGIVRYGITTALFLLGLMSKPQIIMLPLVLLVWDYWPLERIAIGHSLFAFRQRGPSDSSGERQMANGEQRSITWLVLEKLPLFFICLMDASVTLIAQHVGGEKQPWPLWARLENAVVSYTRYIRKAFWPTNLALYYPHPGATLRFWQWGGACVVLALITAWAWHERRRHRYLLAGWLWFVIMLIPMIGIVQADVQGMADRYAYLSFVGLFVMICWGVADWARGRHLPAPLLPAVAIAALLALTAVTHHQIGFWADDISLWSHSAQVTTNNWKAELMWGSALDVQGDHDAAVQHYLAASKIERHDPFIETAIATYEHTHGNFPMALEYYNRALADGWNSEQRATTLQNLAAVYRLMGDPAKAQECLAKINTLPQRKVNWQGAWWQQIIPQLEQWLHGGKT
jgi:tetratricopeptide (TPR) repeat protein